MCQTVNRTVRWLSNRRAFDEVRRSSFEGEAVRILDHPAIDEIQLAEVMQALSSPVRLQLVANYADGEWHGCSPQECDVDVHKSTLSHHFRTLREAGVTMTKEDGRNRYVRLRRDDLNERFPGLLDAVLEALDKPAAQPRSPGS